MQQSTLNSPTLVARQGAPQRKLGRFAEFRRAFSGLQREETIAGYLFIALNLLCA